MVNPGMPPVEEGLNQSEKIKSERVKISSLMQDKI
jgi:hypothetical protein